MKRFRQIAFIIVAVAWIGGGYWMWNFGRSDYSRYMAIMMIAAGVIIFGMLPFIKDET